MRLRLRAFMFAPSAFAAFCVPGTPTKAKKSFSTFSRVEDRTSVASHHVPKGVRWRSCVEHSSRRLARCPHPLLPWQWRDLPSKFGRGFCLTRLGWARHRRQADRADNGRFCRASPLAMTIKCPPIFDFSTRTLLSASKKGMPRPLHGNRMVCL